MQYQTEKDIPKAPSLSYQDLKKSLTLAFAISLQLIAFSAQATMNIESWVSVATDKSKRISRYLPVQSSSSLSAEIRIDTSKTGQVMEGLGASLTDSSAKLIADLPSLQRTRLLRALFSRIDGIGMNYVRVPLGGSDFTHPSSGHHYTYNDIHSRFWKWRSDQKNLSKLSISHDDEYIIPLLHEIRKIKRSEGDDLKLMATAWTAPGWMKDNNSLYGGTLRSGKESLYAEYLARVMLEFNKRGRNIIFDTITLQNEPAHSDCFYPTTNLSVDQQKSLGIALGKQLEVKSIGTKILAWDHNWKNSGEQYSFPLDFFSSSTDVAKYVAGTAWHAYGGTPENQGRFYRANPKQEVYFTEITAHGDYNGVDAFLDLGWSFKNALMGSINNGAKTALYWNLALDRQHGPKLPGGCENCKGIVTLDGDGKFIFEHEYYSVGHISKFMRRGALHVESTVKGDLNFHSTAFKNSDGSIIAVVYNDNWETKSYTLKINGVSFGFSLDGKSVITHVVSTQK